MKKVYTYSIREHNDLNCWQPEEKVYATFEMARAALLRFVSGEFEQIPIKEEMNGQGRAILIFKYRNGYVYPMEVMA